jgi:hypothetical protein
MHLFEQQLRSMCSTPVSFLFIYKNIQKIIRFGVNWGTPMQGKIGVVCGEKKGINS